MALEKNGVFFLRLSVTLLQLTQTRADFFGGAHSSALRISLHLKLCRASSDGISDGILNKKIWKIWWPLLFGPHRDDKTRIQGFVCLPELVHVLPNSYSDGTYAFSMDGISSSESVDLTLVCLVFIRTPWKPLARAYMAYHRQLGVQKNKKSHANHIYLSRSRTIPRSNKYVWTKKY